MTTTPGSDEFLLIGRIVGSFGLRGMLKVVAITADIDHLERKVKQVYVGPKRKPYGLSSVAEHKPGLLLVALEGLTDRTSADLLRSADVWIREGDAAPLAEGEYFLHSLIGLRVITDEGEELGRVREVFETGANDVLVVARPDGGEVLLPVIKDVVRAIDIPGGQIEVHLLPGLL